MQLNYAAQHECFTPGRGGLNGKDDNFHYEFYPTLYILRTTQTQPKVGLLRKATQPV